MGTGIHAFTAVLERSEQHAIGTVDEVRDQLVRQWKELPAEYLTIIMHYAQQPLESVVGTSTVHDRRSSPPSTR